MPAVGRLWPSGDDDEVGDGDDSMRFIMMEMEMIMMITGRMLQLQVMMMTINRKAFGPGFQLSTKIIARTLFCSFFVVPLCQSAGLTCTLVNSSSFLRNSIY